MYEYSLKFYLKKFKFRWQRTASFFGFVDKKIDQLKQKKTLLVQYKKGLMQQIFSRQLQFKGNNDKEFPNWQEKRLGEIVDLRGRIGWKGLTTKDYMEEGPLLLGVTNITKGNKLTLDGAKHIPQAKYDDSPEIMLKNGFLLLAKTGATIGKVCVVKNLVEPATVNAAVNVIECNESIVIPEFLYQQLIGENCQSQMWSFASPGAQPNLFQRDTRKIKIKIPVKEEQQGIANFLSVIDKKIEFVNTQIKNTKQFKKGLLQQMFV